MSVPSSVSKIQYTLTAAAQTLAVPFYFIANSHVRVIRTRAEAETVLTAGYSLSGAGVLTGGTLTLDGTQTQAGDRITIRRALPMTQAISYAENDKFRAKTHERGLDEATMRDQQALETAERGMLYGEGEVLTSGNRLPAVASRKERVLGFDSDGRLDMRLTVDALNTLIVANPVAGLTNVTDYGSVGDPANNVADYGSIA